MDQIVQIIDSLEFGLLCRSIYGLNIFEANWITVEKPFDPRLVFLRCVSEQTQCSALTGYLSLKDLVDDPAEMFGEPNGTLPYQRVPVGLYGGTFYDLSVFPTQNACFFPLVRKDFWLVETEDKQSDIRKVLRHDALSLFARISDDSKLESLHTLSLPFPGEAQLIHLMLKFYSLVIVSGGDAMCFHIYSNDNKSFEIIEEPLSQAIQAVETSEWYSTNRDNLIWDNDEAMCLVIS